MVLAPVTVSRWLGTLSPATLWRSWLLFLTAKNKPPLVLPLIAAGGESASSTFRLCWAIGLAAESVPLSSWRELWSFFPLVWAQGSRVLHDCLICTASRLLSAFTHELGTWWPWTGAVVIVQSFFSLVKGNIYNLFLLNKQAAWYKRLPNKHLLKKSSVTEPQKWFSSEWPSC